MPKIENNLLHHEVIMHSTSSDWIVMVHGAGGSSKTWNHQVDYLKKEFNLLLLDLRDHGLSKSLYPKLDVYRLDLISTDILNVLDHLQIKKSHFLTLSLGSVLIQHFMMKYPSRVDRIIMAGGVFKGTFFMKTLARLAFGLNRFLTYPQMYKMFSYIIMPRKRNAFARRVYRRQAMKLTKNEYLKWIGLYKEVFEILKYFFKGSINHKIAVIMGTQDYVFLSGARAFAKLQPNAELIEMEGIGHICNLESPTTFNQLALNFLKR
ncbi:MAG: alpha/beta hydrolase [bacterium]|nr:alpha/beta hydrolase [bacterium]